MPAITITDPVRQDRFIRVFNAIEAAFDDPDTRRSGVACTVHLLADEAGVWVLSNRTGDHVILRPDTPRDWTAAHGGEEAVVAAALQAARRRGDNRPRRQVVDQVRYLIRLYRRAQQFGVVVVPEDED